MARIEKLNKTFCYHTRLSNNNTVKLQGGMLHASGIEDAYERVAAMYTIQVSKTSISGTPEFIDKEGRKISIYLSVHAEHTDTHKEEITRQRKIIAEERDRIDAENNALESKLASLLDNLSTVKAIELLENHLETS